MLRPQQPDRTWEGWARRQHGVIARVQALEAGVTSGQINWRLRSSRWTEVQPGVYLIGGAPRTSRGRLMAACLWGGPTAVPLIERPGHLWNLAGVEPGFIEIVVDRCLRSESVIVHRLPAPPQWILHRDSIPVCDPTTTIFSTRGRAPSVQTGGRPRPRDEVEADPRRPTERPPRPSGAPWPQRDLDHQKAPRGKRPGCGPHCKHPRRSPKPIDQEVRASASCSPVQRL